MSKETETKLWDLIKGVKVAMLTTMDAERDQLRSRPLITLETNTEPGDLWFLIARNSAKADDVDKEWRVNLSFANPEHGVFVSVSGVAEMVNDREHIRKLWNPLQRAFFPQGPEDPNIGLLRVRVVAAEYWDSPESLVGKVVSLAGGVAKALVTGKPTAVLSENEKVELDH